MSIPVQSEVNLTGPQPQLVLSDLAQPLSGGEAIPLTLDFAHAGSVTLEVPVEAQSYYFSSYSPPPIAAPSDRRHGHGHAYGQRERPRLTPYAD